MSWKRMRKLYFTAAWRLATAAAPGSRWANSAAVAVLATSCSEACGTFLLSQLRHCDNACGLL